MAPVHKCNLAHLCPASRSRKITTIGVYDDDLTLIRPLEGKMMTCARAVKRVTYWEQRFPGSLIMVDHC